MSSAASTPSRSTSSRSRSLLIGLGVVGGVALVALVIYAVSQAEEKALSTNELNTEYGGQEGRGYRDSVNGTRVLADMFRERGHLVTIWSRLSPKLKRFDTLVWFPDSMEPPGAEQRRWLEQWLAAKSGRTLVYVGRDYDAEVTYCKQLLPTASESDAKELREQLDGAKSRRETRLNWADGATHTDWFVSDPRKVVRDVRELEGPWSRGVDAKKTWLELGTAYDVPQEAKRVDDRYPDDDPYVDDYYYNDREYYGRSSAYSAQVLLSSQGDPLVTKLTDEYAWNDSKILVVTNGSFLLNLPLVNHEHRKLAGKLIDECSSNKQVIFLESEGRQIGVGTRDFEPEKAAWYRMLTVWPLNAVVLHVMVAGILLCCALYPIFGRPRQPDEEDTSDFGKHIDAIADLLARSEDTGYARQRWNYYHEKVKRDSGMSHRDPQSTTEAPIEPTID